MKKILLLLFLLLFLFSKNIYAAQTYYKYLKYKNYQPKGPQKTFGETFEQNPYYIGLGYGLVLSNNTEYAKEYQNTNLPALSKLDQQISLFVGYNVFSFLAVELEHHLENKTSENSSYIDPVRKQVNTENNYSRNSMYFANLVVKYPYLYKHIPFIKLGVGYSKFHTAHKKIFEGVWDPSEARYSYDAKSILLKAGLGYEYMINNHHSIQLEYDYITTPNKIDVTEIYHDGYSIVLDKRQTFKQAATLSYSKINVAYKFSF